MLFKKKEYLGWAYVPFAESYDVYPLSNAKEFWRRWKYLTTEILHFVSQGKQILLELILTYVYMDLESNLPVGIIFQHTVHVVKNQTWWLTTLKFRIYSIYTFFSEYGINDHRCTVLIKSKSLQVKNVCSISRFMVKF